MNYTIEKYGKTDFSAQLVKVASFDPWYWPTLDEVLKIFQQEFGQAFGADRATHWVSVFFGDCRVCISGNYGSMYGSRNCSLQYLLNMAKSQFDGVDLKNLRVVQNFDRYEFELVKVDENNIFEDRELPPSSSWTRERDHT
ncbi:MAG: hypothetical protein HY226_01340 [Candidatus Vogelbacteria bacterium]|nr:hypothetical protein [Candidatus Vogelbacteria bacterium]